MQYIDFSHFPHFLLSRFMNMFDKDPCLIRNFSDLHNETTTTLKINECKLVPIKSYKRTLHHPIYLTRTLLKLLEHNSPTVKYVIVSLVFVKTNVFGGNHMHYLLRVESSNFFKVVNIFLK